MTSFLFIFGVLFYAGILLILFIFGINFLYLAYIAFRTRDTVPAGNDLSELPTVSIQLPIYNELYVAERLIDAVAKFDWPKDRLEIIALDDSTDETREIVRAAVERWRTHEFNIRQLHRTDRKGYKAGALALGLAQTRAEYIAYFDADFLPAPDFLEKTIPAFSEPKIAFVQTRWGHINRDYSLITFLQSLAIDAHFMVEQFARSRRGYWFNFNGTGGVWRRAAIEDAGGWAQDTLTEDLDLSYRVFLKGWQARYLRGVVTPAELPVTFSAYRRQQHRWAKGSFECAVKLLPQLWRSSASLGRKVESTLHLGGYSIHLFMFALMLLYPAILYFSLHFPDLLALFGIGALFNLTALAPTMYFTLAQNQIGGSWWRKIPAILFITCLGAGMMTNTVRAGWQFALGRGKTFERTPKFGISNRDESWLGKRYQLALDPIIIFDLFVAVWNMGTVFLAVQLQNWVIGVYAGIFVVGAIFVSALTLTQYFAERAYRRKTNVPNSLPIQA